MDDILVSINCLAYNHEPFIADAIESFLMQKTKFKFEILIHDDCSTDGTVEIIKKYEKKYPDIIKPLYQKENQYHKGVRVGDINKNRALGRYIAICEGDDYWTSEDKLQKQVDYMEAHPDCSMCFHAAKFVNVSKKTIGSPYRIYDKDSLTSMEDVLVKSSPEYIPTASRLYRKECESHTPQWLLDCCVGDYPMSLLLATTGEIFYMNEVMSAYRVNVPGSWTSRTIRGKNEAEGNIKVLKNMIETLEEFNVDTYYKYDQEVQTAIQAKQLRILIYEKNIREIKSGDFKYHYTRMKPLGKLKLFLYCYLPKTYYSLALVKKKIMRMA
jgi:glycosyltransferase involved in cell wall biosynthesis